MNKLLIAVAFCFFASVQQVSAHAEGLTPFLSINGVSPDMHPLQKESIITTSIVIPEDLAKESYLINEPVSFTIDTDVLAKVYSEDALSTITYEWDFGDGASAEGTAVRHTYTSIGSKIVTIYANFNDPEAGLPPQKIEIVQVNIAPDASYTLPQPYIIANNKALDGDSHEVNMQNPVAFDVQFRNTPSADIASYQWDFGEGGKSTAKKAVYRYTTDPAIVTPVLKVTDKNGFIVFTSGLLTNGKTTEGYTFATNTVGAIILGVQALVVVVGVAWFGFVIWQQKHKRKKKS